MTGSASEEAHRLAQLEAEERALSSRRRRIHDRIDFIRSGASETTVDSVETLRRLEEEEREISATRRVLHVEIDALRIRLGQQPGARPRPRLLGA